ncbi:hypothetical protein AJ85_06380 [Alkalihalobacillus alcalophilus ATCC 27647 = CGMCC 1.3604]|uniref:DUF4358 domain-containing protein n=1 Tax=Alkalihalobacillus alcalophilus ATCC 27647 = CGMCC 1.3604 TaxID=1218173 RepID=A0A4S4K200_ALKAL|nr:DUF4358 domain-containing protein [Alkalihalobacillus alcalophilus]MED1560831.1 DUF4358 domain-containing protein [Alkalihalobacillus alcalophilus]THG91220.1 hypothetical protein AJ85_06380 [Alkalihalobacillus alcalophilus ATCC 27647 = CGMCC 1.3604]
MKNFLRLLTMALVVFTLIGCNSGDNDEGENQSGEISLEEIFSSIKDQIAEDLQEAGLGEDVYVDGQLQMYIETDLTDETATDDPLVEMLLENMKIDSSQLANGYVLQAAMNVNSDQIILLEAADEAEVAALQEGLERELENQHRIWESYLPDQYEKVKNNIIKVDGLFILYATYDDAQKLEAIFDEHL